MNLAEAIKKCSVEAFDACIPCDVLFGEVTGVEPYKIKVGDVNLPDEILSVPEHLLYKATQITLGTYTRTVVINEGLKTGDTVILIKQTGGGNYVVVGRMV